MAGGVGVFDGVVEGVGVAVEALRVAWIRNDGIGLDELAHGGVVVAGVVEVEATTCILDLAGALKEASH